MSISDWRIRHGRPAVPASPTFHKENFMEYMLLIYGDEKAWFGLPKEELEKGYQAYMDYTRELVESGCLRSGSELSPITSATTVRVRNGKPLLTDGPFAETKEQLGGYYLIDVADLDQALAWAAKCPGAWHGSVEVRPVVENPGPEQAS
jgi:hypothetical protein